MRGSGTPRATPVVARAIERFPLERVGVTLAGSALVAPLLMVLLRGCGVPLLVAAAVVASGLTLAAPRIVRALPRGLDGAARWRPVLAVLWLLLALAAVAETARIATFMLDPAAKQHSLFPGSAFYTRHWCASAYLEAARLGRARVANVYDIERYHPGGQPGRMGPFTVDAFQYPPPFLLLPRLGLAVADDPLRLRPIWFALSALLLGASYLGAAAWIGGRAGLRLGLLLPLFWLSMPVLAGLQMGNFHVALVALSLLALILFARGRPAGGGAVLAFCVAAKLSPGLLLVYLGAQRRWRALAWTAGFGVAMVGLSLLVFGLPPFRAFFEYQLARLASGEAFTYIFDPAAIAARPGPVAGNLSLYGLVYKLKALGVAGMGVAVAKAVSLAYLAAILALAAIAGRRSRGTALEAGDRLRLLVRWLALLSLGVFQAPFIPSSYGALSVAWLLMALAVTARRPLALVGLAAVWGLLWLTPSLLPEGPGRFVYGIAVQLVLLVLCVRQVLRPTPLPQPARPPRRFVVAV